MLKVFFACSSLACKVKKSRLYFLKLAARALNIPGVASLSVNSTTLGWFIVLPKTLSMVLLLMRVTMSGKVATAKAWRSLAVLLPARQVQVEQMTPGPNQSLLE